MASTEWPTESGGLVAALIETAESCGVELACLPHLRAVAEELVTGTPSTLVDPIIHEGWRPSLNAAIAGARLLILDTIVLANGPRLYGAMIVLLESMTQGDDNAYDHAKAILNDTRELGDVLLDMQTARRAREQAQIAVDAAVPIDPALVAEIEKIDRLVIDELPLSLPLPLWADAQTSSEPAKLSFLVPAELLRLGALYRAWAPGAGWLFSTVLESDRYWAFELRRGGVEIKILLNTWINGRISLSIELPRPLESKVVPGRGRVMVEPKLPPITRERLPALPAEATSLDQPVALLADGGLVFVANEYDVWMIDPHTRTKTLVASKQGVRMRGLVPDGAGLLGLSSSPVTLHAIGAAGIVSTVVDDRAFAVALCRVGSTAFIACDDGRLIAARIPTGEVIAEIAGFSKELRSLTRVDAMLYALDGRVIRSIDPITHEVATIVELSHAASSIASDDQRIFTLHTKAIGAVDLAERSFMQLTGQPAFGAGQTVAMRDGLAGGTVIESARFLSSDAGNLWFTDDGRLRRFEIRALQTRTLELT